MENNNNFNWRKRFQLLIFVFSFYVFNCIGQTNDNSFNIPDVIPKSPEVASLERYGEVNCSEYTGTPNISVPIHIVKTGSISVPIGATYNATGVRVAQEATWVGLGWDLSCVNAVLYHPNGSNDQCYNGTTIPTSDWCDMSNYIRKSSNYYGVSATFSFEDGTYGFGNFENPCACYDEHPAKICKAPIMGAIKEGIGQLDYFSVNCFGISANFYVDRSTGQAEIFGEDSKIAITTTLNSRGKIEGISIIDESGNIYVFDAREMFGQRYYNAWYLTSIVSPEGKYVRFTYKKYGSIEPIHPLSETYDSQYGMNKKIAHPFSSVNDVLFPLYLSEIETEKETVKFWTSQNRQDIEGSGAARLDSISVTDKFQTNYRKSVIFNYSYFQGSDIGGDYYVDENFTKANCYLSKRLKLNSLELVEGYSNAKKRYGFVYNESVDLPLKTSYAVDHWGFYNGCDNSTFLPVSIYSSGGALDFNGANKGANPQTCSAWTLKKIVYPTGGSTEFTFEPHSFSNTTIYSSTQSGPLTSYKQCASAMVYRGSSSVNSTFTLTSESKVKIKSAFIITPACDDETSSGRTMLLGPVGLSWSSTSPGFQSETKILPAGNYAIVASINTSCSSYDCNYEVSVWVETTTEGNTTISNSSIGGGLRIKKIKNCTSEGIASIKEYEYTTDDDSTSSGILMTPIDYTKKENYKIVCGDSNSANSGIEVRTTGTSTIYSSSTTPLKAIVGYSRVKIQNATSSGSNNGYVIKEFRNKEPYPIFDFLLCTDFCLDNGLLVSSTDYLSNGNYVYKETLDYEDYDDSKKNEQYVNFYMTDTYRGPSCQCTDAGTIRYNECAYVGRWKLYNYTFLRYKYLLSEKKTSEGTVTKIYTYKYNQQNYLPNRVATSTSSTENSKDELYVQEMSYPNDFVSEGNIYDSLNISNRINTLIESRKYKGNSLIDASFNLYSVVGSKIFLTDYYSIDLKCPISKSSFIGLTETGELKSNTQYQKKYSLTYDLTGNVISIDKADDIVVNYMWGYDNQYPVAKIENATLKECIYEEGWQNIANSGDLNLRTLPRGKYRIEFYGGPFDLAPTSQIHINDKVVTLEGDDKWYSIEKIISTISFGGIGNIPSSIKYIRIYPFDAQMTTYTYKPLIGISSETDTNGITTYYEYDDFGRLIRIRNNNGDIVKSYDYNISF
ncbi:RHS repeat domain-containing protein [Labilibaculum euxinus]